MNGKDMLEAMSFVDERYIEEAEKNAAPRRIIRWQSVTAVAACLGLLLVSVRYVLLPMYLNSRLGKVSIAAYDPAEAEPSFMMIEATRSDAEFAMDSTSAEFAAASGNTAAASVTMTVRFLRWEKDTITMVCTVTDPGTSEYQEGAELRIAPDTISILSVNEDAEILVTFLPDAIEDGILHPIELELSEK